MNKFDFRWLRPPKEQVIEKTKSLFADPVLEFDKLFSYCEKRVNTEHLDVIRNTFEFGKGFSSKDPHHPEIIRYLVHPTRVAHSFLRSIVGDASIGDVQVCLLHNFFEITQQSDQVLRTFGLGNGAIQKIRLLTIDRKFESDRRYLKVFYGAIESDSPQLSLIRCMDKLDNLFGVHAISNSSERRLYVELAKEFVAPMAGRLSEDFGRYFVETCEYLESGIDYDSK